MTVGTRIDPTKGLNTTKDTEGLVVERNQQNVGFGPFKVESVKAVTATATLLAGDAGVVTISGSSAVTVTMPSASLGPGSQWLFRAGSASAHVLTASQEVAGTTPFSDGTTKGSKITLGAAVGNSVALWCDGVNFLVVGKSTGSMTITGT